MWIKDYINYLIKNVINFDNIYKNDCCFYDKNLNVMFLIKCDDSFNWQLVKYCFEPIKSNSTYLIDSKYEYMRDYLDQLFDVDNKRFKNNYYDYGIEKIDNVSFMFEKNEGENELTLFPHIGVNLIEKDNDILKNFIIDKTQ